MTLIKCNECGKEVSDQAESCPHCGAPIQGSSAHKIKTKPNGCSGCLAVCGIFIGFIVIGGVISNINVPKKIPENSKQSLNLDGNEAGGRLVRGRSGCERTLKKALRDPDSLQGDDYTIIEASPEKWTAKIQFRSRNGFGGLNDGVAVCSFDGSNYQVQVTSDQ